MKSDSRKKKKKLKYLRKAISHSSVFLTCKYRQKKMDHRINSTLSPLFTFKFNNNNNNNNAWKQREVILFKHNCDYSETKNGEEGTETNSKNIEKEYRVQYLTKERFLILYQHN